MIKIVKVEKPRQADNSDINNAKSNIIAGDACSIIPDATLYQFAILTSNVHNAWMRVVCGRLKSDFRYSPAVYNNYPWPNPTDEQKAKIEKTAQAILDARALYPNSSLADLYDEITARGYINVGINVDSNGNVSIDVDAYIDSIATTTLYPDNKLEVNHIDGNKENNAVSNLE